MTCIDINSKEGDLWFVDSEWSNHMTDIKSLFQELYEMQRIKVQLWNTKEITVEVSTDETRVNSSTYLSASTATQNLSNHHLQHH